MMHIYKSIEGKSQNPGLPFQQRYFLSNKPPVTVLFGNKCQREVNFQRPHPRKKMLHLDIVP